MRFGSDQQVFPRKKIVPAVFVVCAFACLVACSEKPSVAARVPQDAPAVLRAIDGYFNRPVPGSIVTAAYMTLQNESDIALTLATFMSNAAGRVELHNHEMRDGFMQMRRVGQLTIEAGESIHFEPGGYHLMLFDVSDSLQTVDSIELILGMTSGQSVTVQVQARELIESSG